MMKFTIRNITLLALLALLSWAWWGCGGGGAIGAVQGSLRVVVTLDGNPEGGVSLLLTPGNYTGTTGADGSYTFTLIPSGTYTVAAAKGAYSYTATGIQVNSGLSTEVNISLSSGAGAISGTVWAQRATAVEGMIGATVTITGTTLSTTSTISGSFFIPNVSPGTHSLQALKVLPDTTRMIGEVTGVKVNPGQTTVNVCVLALPDGQTGAIAGTVVGNRATLLDQVKLVIKTGTADQEAFLEAWTNPAGQYLFPRILPGNYAIYATKQGYQDAVSGIVTVTQGNTATENLALQPAGGQSLSAPTDPWAGVYTLPTEATPRAYLGIRQALLQRTRGRGWDRRMRMLQDLTRQTRVPPAGSYIEIDFFWTGPNPTVERDLAGFNIYRSTSQSGPFALIKTVANPLAYYCWDLDPSLSVGQAYWYVVKSYGTAGQVSAPSTPVSATPLGKLTLASPPDGATGQPPQVPLSWNPLSGAKAYLIFLYEVFPDIGMIPSSSSKVSATQTSLLIGPLNSGQRYWWVVVGINNEDEYWANAASFSQIWSFQIQ